MSKGRDEDEKKERKNGDIKKEGKSKEERGVFHQVLRDFFCKAVGGKITKRSTKRSRVHRSPQRGLESRW